jgi:curved DNA-binding protein CbpA
MDYTHPSLWPQLIDLSNRIDSLNYFEILNLPQTATIGEIRRAYYQFARTLHPDKFFQIEDTDVREAIHRIYKRVTEAYGILKNDLKKSRYIGNINSENGASMLRYDEQQENAQKLEEREQQEVAKTPQGKKMYQAALVELGNKNFAQALKNVQSAMLFESANEVFVELQSKIKEMTEQK